MNKNTNGNIELQPLNNIYKNNFSNNYIKSIPDPAFLVIGISKKYNISRRIYNNESFYFLDDINPKKHNKEYKNRFIYCDFNKKKQLKIIAKIFKEKFNLIFFDYSVFKFFNYMSYLKYLLETLKHGGYLFIPDYHITSFLTPNMTYSEYLNISQEEKFKLYKKKVINIRNNILEYLQTSLHLNANIIKIKDLITKFGNISRNIYINSDCPKNQESYGFIIKKE